MKKSFLMFLAAATLGMYSCSDKITEEGIVASQPQTDGTTEEGYISFQINTIDNSGTRAEGDTPENGSFDQGEADESVINKELGANIVFFFDQEKKYHSKSVLQILDNGKTDGTDKIYNARIIKDDPNNEIESCLVLLNVNPTDFEDNQFKITKGDNYQKFIETLITSNYKNDSFYAMSNSVYTSNDSLKGLVNIQGKIFPTMDEAQKNKVIIHVERIAVKYELTYDDEYPKKDANTISDSESNTISVRKGNTITEKTWTAKLVGWGINGTEQESYWVKNLHDGSNFAWTTETMTQTNFGKWTKDWSETTGAYGWNDYARFRSYWAIDTHYNNSETDYYPQQYRQALDDTTIKSKDGVNTIPALKYISYNKLTAKSKTPQYSLENTFAAYDWFTKSTNSKYDFAGIDYKRTSTHALIAAKLIIDGEKEDTEIYCYEGIYWVIDEDNTVNDLITYMAEAVLLYDYKTLYKDTAMEQKYNNETDAAEYFKLGKATVKGGDGRLMLVAQKDLYYKDAKGEAAKVDFTEAIYKVGTAKHFNKGMMYYYVPIKHMVPVDKNTGDYSVGSYGVVRNHWYKMTVTSISKPGTSVDDPDQEIIPNDDPDNGSYAAFEIVIIPWHVIEDNDVQL